MARVEIGFVILRAWYEHFLFFIGITGAVMDENAVVKQMLDVTGHRVDRSQRELFECQRTLDQVLSDYERAKSDKEDSVREAPARRRKILAELMEKNPPRLEGVMAVAAQGSVKGKSHVEVKSALDRYSMASLRLNTELAEHERQYLEADQRRQSCFKALEDAQKALRVSIIRREKWIALSQEISLNSFGG